VVANRLDKILRRCKNLEDYKRNISSLSKYAQKAANSNHGTIVQFSFADVKVMQDDIKSNLANWCNAIEDKIESMDRKQNRILESMANISEWVEGLQAVVKEIESQVGKVTNASDKIVSTASPYQDALLEGPGRMGKKAVDGRVLYDIE